MVRVSVAAAIVVAIVFAILFSPVFKINSIEFNAESCITDQKQLEKYQVLGKNILIFKSARLNSDLKSDFSCIDQIKTNKVFPQKLKIEITAQSPVAKIESSDLAVTKDGTVRQSTQANLPTIFLPAGVQAAVGKRLVDTTTLFALDVAGQLRKSDFTPQNIRIVDGGDVAVYDTTGVIALFLPTKDATLQVDSLQAILAHSKIDEAKIAKIDLRFDKPVIVNKQ